MGRTERASALQGRAMRFLHSQAGNIMPMAAIAMVALAGLVGGGVDVSRAYMVQNRLQNACDAGVLAGRKAVEANGFDQAAIDDANLYFDTNFDEANEGVTGTSFTATSPNSGDTVNGTATTTVNTAVMQLFGFQTIPLTVDCTATMSLGNSDVMMVLDVTGSMACTSAMTQSQCQTHIDDNGYDETAHGGESRLEELRGAMLSFYDTLDAATAGSNSRIRYGFVPYNGTVNVGSIIMGENPAWIVDNHTYQSREPQYVTTYHDTVTGYEDPYTQSYSGTDNRWNGSGYYYRPTTKYEDDDDCLDALPADTAWANNGDDDTDTRTYIDSNDRRITETTTRQPQKRRNYWCHKYAKKAWYRAYRDEYRDYVEVVREIEDPIYTTTSTTSFDHFDYKAMTYDVSSYKSGGSLVIPTGTDGANQSFTWDGCIEERASVAQSTFSYDSVTGLSPSDAKDLDIDLAPNAGDDTTKWRPWLPGATYGRTNSAYSAWAASSTVSDYGLLRGGFCPPASAQFASLDRATFDAYASALYPSGPTYHDIGMIWGARLASPTGPFQSNVTSAPANNATVARHIIFMTDGHLSPSHTRNSAYGLELHDWRVTNDGSSNQTSRHNARFLAVCEQAKAKGIRVWVIAFASTLTTDLNNCASTNSAFFAANKAQLNTRFQEIAKDVGELRITQ